MRQAIVARYHGPTNTRGSYIRVKCEAKTRAYGWNYTLDTYENHRAAIEALLTELGWNGAWYVGALPGGGYVAVNDTQSLQALVVR